jgi:predicted transcriptional regulator YheO
MSATAFQRLRREIEAKKLAEVMAEQEDSENEQSEGPTKKQIMELLKEKGIKFNNRDNKETLSKLLEGAE